MNRSRSMLRAIRVAGSGIIWILVLAALGSAGATRNARAQAAASAPGDAAAPAAPAPALATAPAAAAPPPETATPSAMPAEPGRASWTSDRMPRRAGDILTVVIDEQTAAREFVSRLARANRSQEANLRAQADGKKAIDPTGIQSSIDGDSRDIGEANRQGDLVATLSVRVTEVTPGGLLRIEGSKKLNVDGREQEITLRGIVRPDDVPPSNMIASSRIADAEIGYKGKKLEPRRSIIGRILSVLWP